MRHIFKIRTIAPICMLGIPSVAITGAGGFVARNLRRHLADYRLLSFSRNKFRPLKNEKAVVTDYSSQKRLASKLRSCDILVHLAGIGESSSRYSCTDVNTNLTSAVISAAKSARIKQVIFLSGLGASSSNPTEYFISKFQAERVIRASGLGYTILRPSFIVGHDGYLERLLNDQVKGGRVLVPGDGQCILQPISIHDVVRIIQSSFLNKKFLKKTLDLVGPDAVTFENFVRLFCKNKPAKISKVPLERCLQSAFADKNPAYGIGDLNLFYGGHVGDFEKLQKAYGDPIGSVRDFL